jgi:hypothetical protein
MRITSAIIGRFRQTRRDDPMFGELLYMGDRRRYWEGKAQFPPTHTKIEVFVDGSVDDTLDQQHGFFQYLMKTWPDLSAVLGSVLLQKWREQMPETPVKSAWEIFSLSSVSIPKDSLEKAQWEISFVNAADPDNLWTLRMHGREIAELVIDG